MIPQTPQADLFIQPLRDALRRKTRGSRAIKIAKHDNVYTCGEQGEAVYFLESGQVKLVRVSPEGRVHLCRAWGGRSFRRVEPVRD